MMFSILLGVCAGKILYFIHCQKHSPDFLKILMTLSQNSSVLLLSLVLEPHLGEEVAIEASKQGNKTVPVTRLPVLSRTQNQGIENEYLGAACNTCMPHSGLHRQPSELSRGKRRSIPSSPIRRNLSTKSPKIRIKKVEDSILNAHSLKLDTWLTWSLRWPRFTNSSASSGDTCSAWISQQQKKTQNGRQI